MLKISGAEDPLGQQQARELLARQPKVVRHTRAWVDDKELCLEVECALNDGAALLIKMMYCWDDCWDSCEDRAASRRSPYYFMDVAEWLLNNQWLEFYRWVQEQFDRTLAQQASDDSFAEYDEPHPDGKVQEAEPLSWPTDLNKNEDPGTA